MSAVPRFYLGAYRTPNKPPAVGQACMPAHHCCTHVVSFGASGSGKAGMTLVMVQEALRNGVPVLMIDVKGDLPNLLLRFPSPSVEDLVQNTAVRARSAMASSAPGGLRRGCPWSCVRSAYFFSRSSGAGLVDVSRPGLPRWPG